jgi:antitoxin component YwqK of YwqJK toxin-antitoxin module
MENQLNKKGNKEGKWIFKSKSGKKLAVYNYKDGVKQGPQTEYYSNGRVESIDNYVDGKLHGLSIRYADKSGKQIESSGSYNNGVKEGLWEENDIIEGYRHCKGTYENDKKNGHWTEKRLNMIYRGTYRNDEKDGGWIGEFAKGETINVEGGIAYLGYYINGIKEGLEISYQSPGIIWKQCEFKNGILDGLFIKYFHTGEICEKGNYNNGVRDGEWLDNSDNNKFNGKPVLYVAGKIQRPRK